MKALKSRILSFAPLASLKKRLTKSHLTERFSRGAFWTLMGNITWRFLSAISTIAVARILGPKIFGEFGMIYSTINMFSVYAGFRLGTTATKYVSEHRKKDPDKAGRILKLTLIASFILCASAGLIHFILSPYLAGNILNNPGLATGLSLGAFLLFFLVYGEVKQFALAGFENFKAIAKVNIFRGALTPLLVIPMAYFWGAEGAIAGLAIVAALMFSRVSIFLRRESVNARFPERIPLSDVKKEVSILWKFALPGFLIGVITISMMWVGRVILTRLDNGYVEIGLFTAADQWRLIILFIPMVLAPVILPILSETYGNKSNDEFKKAISFQVHSILLITLPLTTLVIGLADFLALIYGSKFRGVEDIIPILMVSVFFHALNMSLSLIFTSSEKRWINLTMHIGWGFAFLLGCLVFIPIKGAIGLGITMLIADVILLSSQVLYIEFTLAPGALRRFFKLIVYSIFLFSSAYFAQNQLALNLAIPILCFLFIMSLMPLYLEFRKKMRN